MDIDYSALQYAQHLLSLGDQKILQQVPDLDALDTLRAALQAHCHHTSRPCFYIHSPEQLITSAPYIQHQQQADGHISGKLCAGPGGLCIIFSWQMG